MAIKADLQDWVLEALKHFGGKSQIVPIAEFIWHKYQKDLELSGKLLFTWQYDMRWAANELRNKGKIKPISKSPRGVWELS